MLSVEQGHWLKGGVYTYLVREKSLLLHSEVFWEEQELPRLTLSGLVGQARDLRFDTLTPLKQNRESQACLSAGSELG